MEKLPLLLLLRIFCLISLFCLLPCPSTPHLYPPLNPAHFVYPLIPFLTPIHSSPTTSHLIGEFSQRQPPQPLVGGVAQWSGRRSLAGGLSLIYASSMVDV